MTLFDMIKDWRRVLIEKKPDDEVIEFHRDIVERMREKVGPDVVILSFSGAEGGLFGVGIIVALNQSGDIIATEQIFIS
jgi:hypothetical protein